MLQKFENMRQPKVISPENEPQNQTTNLAPNSEVPKSILRNRSYFFGTPPKPIKSDAKGPISISSFSFELLGVQSTPHILNYAIIYPGIPPYQSLKRIGSF